MKVTVDLPGELLKEGEQLVMYKDSPDSRYRQEVFRFIAPGTLGESSNRIIHIQAIEIRAEEE